MKNIFIVFALFIAFAQTRDYPMYKQCDPQWANDQLGTSPLNTICKAGCLMSSAAMALSATGNNYNPRTLNSWLKNNKGYVQDDLFVWASINSIGLTFKGFITNSQIKNYVDAGYVVIVNVRNGGHWVLVKSYTDSSVIVNDPGFSVNSYDFSQIVNGNTGVYTINKLPNWLSGYF